MEKKNLGKVLKEKIQQDAKIDVTIPEFGETYELSAIQTNENVKENIDIVKMTNKIERKAKYPSVRTELIGRLEKLKDEMNDMDTYVRQDLDDKNLRDDDIFRINEKIKELEKQIINVIEG